MFMKYLYSFFMGRVNCKTSSFSGSVSAAPAFFKKMRSSRLRSQGFCNFLLRIVVFSFFCAACLSLSAAQAAAPPSPDALRLRLLESVGQLPSNPEYRLDGRFVLMASGEDLLYQANIVQTSAYTAGRTNIRRVADFTHENPTRNLRFSLTGTTAWAASPEITVDVMAEQIPFMARFDFHTLYAELLDILAAAQRSPEFRIEQKDNEIHVYGRLRNGWDAVFILNNAEMYPRKVKISTDGKETAAWMIPRVSPGDVWQPQPFPGWTKEFDVWMSSPASGGDGYYRYAQRIDFLQDAHVVGSFLIRENPLVTANAAKTEEIFARPPVFPWEKGIQFEPDEGVRGNIFTDDYLRGMRSRLYDGPWAQWKHQGRVIAYFSIASSWLSFLMPYPVPPKAQAWILISMFTRSARICCSQILPTKQRPKVLKKLAVPVRTILKIFPPALTDLLRSL